MKKFFWLTSFLIWFLISFVQGQNLDQRGSVIDNSTGNFIYISQYVDIQGSQFLYDDWMNGKVVLNNGRLFKNLQMKFDIYENKFIVNKNDTAYEINPAVHKVWLYPNGSDTSNALIFEKGFEINQKINSKIYLQILAEGKFTFLKYINKYIENYTEYGNATNLKRFNEYYQYFVYREGKFEAVKLSKKELEDKLSDKSTDISSYFLKNNLSGKDENSWIKTIQYYNTLH